MTTTFSRRSLTAMLLCAATLGFATTAFAGTTGGIDGTLTDADTKAPIAGAKITMKSPSQVVSGTTDGGGHFSFQNLAPDTYVIAADKTGYQPASETDVEVVADQQQTVNLTQLKASSNGSRSKAFLIVK